MPPTTYFERSGLGPPVFGRWLVASKKSFPICPIFPHFSWKTPANMDFRQLIWGIQFRRLRAFKGGNKKGLFSAQNANMSFRRRISGIQLSIKRQKKAVRTYKKLSSSGLVRRWRQLAFLAKKQPCFVSPLNAHSNTPSFYFESRYY